MEQEKIGKFILELRKEKNMTQQELADKIGVTDRAISKWENGRGLPDLSLLRPLCDELGITINELLSGERIEKKDYERKLEENILNTIDYTDRKIKNTTRVFKIVITTIVIVIISIASMFITDVGMMRQSKPVVFSTWGIDYAPAIDLYEEDIKLAIKYHLVREGDSELKYQKGQKTFASMKVYLIDELKSDELFNVYAWVREGKYYLDNDELKEESGSSIPHRFTVEKIDGEYIVTDYQIPRDGSYAEDMKELFPKSVRDDMDKVYSDGTAEKLELDIEEQAKLYFHKQ